MYLLYILSHDTTGKGGLGDHQQGNRNCQQVFHRENPFVERVLNRYDMRRHGTGRDGAHDKSQPWGYHYTNRTNNVRHDTTSAASLLLVYEGRTVGECRAGMGFGLR